MADDLLSPQYPEETYPSVSPRRPPSQYSVDGGQLADLQFAIEQLTQAVQALTEQLGLESWMSTYGAKIGVRPELARPTTPVGQPPRDPWNQDQ
jgi:hypothetical protein